MRNAKRLSVLAQSDNAVEQCDVVVIGGGPAGSTAAALLAKRGYQVIALEKQHHPRFHIGESLLPMNLPVFERLGVHEKVRALGVFKGGADFEAANACGFYTFAFERALGASPAHAYQVWRQDFDQMLFAHARECGADAREGHEVISSEQSDSRASRLQVRTDKGRSYHIQARYVIDASGRDAFLAGKKKLRRKNPEHQSAAIFGHFRGAQVRAGADAGNISIYRFAHGWMWMIPLPAGVMSVGAVCWPDYLKQRKGRTVEFLLETLQQNAALWQRLKDAQLIGNEVRVTGNYSYDSTCMGGPGWILVGDAFAFLDPVFSSGVYLAMSGAEQAAALVDARYASRRASASCCAAWRSACAPAWSVSHFSSIASTVRSSPKCSAVRAISSQLEQGVISMLAGDLFDTPRVLWRLKLFKLFYAAVGLGPVAHLARRTQLSAGPGARAVQRRYDTAR